MLGGAGDTVGTKAGLALPSGGSQSSREDRPGIGNNSLSNSLIMTALRSVQRGVLESREQGDFLRHTVLSQALRAEISREKSTGSVSKAGTRVIGGLTTCQALDMGASRSHMILSVITMLMISF